MWLKLKADNFEHHPRTNSFQSRVKMSAFNYRCPIIVETLILHLETGYRDDREVTKFKSKTCVVVTGEHVFCIICVHFMWPSFLTLL